VELKQNLTTETVDQLKLATPVVVTPDSSVRESLRRLKEQGAGSLLVCRDGVLVGIFTERDAMRLLAEGADLDVPIERVMVHNPATVEVGDTVATAIRKMATGGYRRLPIVDAQGRVVGKINVTGIVHYLVEHFPKAVYNLPPSPQPVMLERDGA
jgi:CBS domain-containing protein